jgi:hypothetical protein
MIIIANNHYMNHSLIFIGFNVQLFNFIDESPYIINLFWNLYICKSFKETKISYLRLNTC